jgi:hypothetical protein
MMDDQTPEFLRLLRELDPAQRAAIAAFGSQTKADPFTAAYTLAAALGYSDRYATRHAKKWQSLHVPKPSMGVAILAVSTPAVAGDKPAAGFDHRDDP